MGRSLRKSHSLNIHSSKRGCCTTVVYTHVVWFEDDDLDDHRWARTVNHNNHGGRDSGWSRVGDAGQGESRTLGRVIESENTCFLERQAAPMSSHHLSHHLVLRPGPSGSALVTARALFLGVGHGW